MSAPKDKQKKSSPKGYYQITDGEWISVIKKGFREQCCSCGLTHKTDFRIMDGIFQFRCVVDNRATAAARRVFKFTKDED